MTGRDDATDEVPSESPELRTERVRTQAQLDAAWSVRLEVFVAEQQVPLDEEMDAADTAPTTTHVIVTTVEPGQDRDGGRTVDDEDVPPVAVATGRLLTDPSHPGVVHIGRVAVRRRWRTGGVGALIMRALEELACEEHALDGTLRVELSAQEQAIGFYERLGYTVAGPRYLDAGIWHRDAHKTVVGLSAPGHDG
ncbi:GNAT family N-acetyltransferase [Sanguibacter antarcticus]|uniref:Putative GNAT family N-acyltransferase n=1 Tax=Sanguibacter antarcticus TaxID=372484 RepID=A0A2A9E4H6_9MICO|nr:GNAT family N-acetyltransferase [Sanguibacter antarcticus]PFG33451.1 putative GNAT family N-acyltransferase [Sanguibacter antarcticus]